MRSNAHHFSRTRQQHRQPIYYLRAAVKAVSTQVHLTAVSPVYEATPMYVSDNPRFLNMADLKETKLIKAEYNVETKCPEGFGPRTVGAVLVHDKRADKPSPTPAPRVQRQRSIPLKGRDAVFRRAENRCQQCGKSAAGGVKLEIDYIMLVSRGGSDNISNLQLLYFDCNRGKSDRMD